MPRSGPLQLVRWAAPDAPDPTLPTRTSNGEVEWKAAVRSLCRGFVFLGLPCSDMMTDSGLLPVHSRCSVGPRR
jgi:hypothetical protein